jgi:serine/threonine protein kinase
MLLNSRMARGASRLIHTAVGSARGNAGYMAPEQWRGGDLDQRVDIWGVGVLLWEALTAERFIPTEDPQTAAAITLHGNLPRVETLVPDLPPALAAIVSRALQRDPDLRFQSAASFHRELREFVDLYRVDIDRDRGAHFLAEHHADQMDREVPLQGPVNASGDCIPSPPPGRTAAAAKPLAPSRRPPLSLPEACVLCSPKPLWRSWMGPVLALCAFVLGMWLGACHLGPVVVGHRVTSEAASTIDSPRSRHLWLAQPLVVDQGGTQGGGPGGG